MILNQVMLFTISYSSDDLSWPCDYPDNRRQQYFCQPWWPTSWQLWPLWWRSCDDFWFNLITLMTIVFTFMTLLMLLITICSMCWKQGWSYDDKVDSLTLWETLANVMWWPKVIPLDLPLMTHGTTAIQSWWLWWPVVTNCDNLYDKLFMTHKITWSHLTTSCDLIW